MSCAWSLCQLWGVDAILRIFPLALDVFSWLPPPLCGPPWRLMAPSWHHFDRLSLQSLLEFPSVRSAELSNRLFYHRRPLLGNSQLEFATQIIPITTLRTLNTISHSLLRCQMLAKYFLVKDRLLARSLSPPLKDSPPDFVKAVNSFCRLRSSSSDPQWHVSIVRSIYDWPF